MKILPLKKRETFKEFNRVFLEFRQLEWNGCKLEIPFRDIKKEIQKRKIPIKLNILQC